MAKISAKWQIAIITEVLERTEKKPMVVKAVSTFIVKDLVSNLIFLLTFTRIGNGGASGSSGQCSHVDPEER